VFWYIGGTDPDAYDKARRAGWISQDIPTNHSPNFAPVIHPTLETGVEAIIVAALRIYQTVSLGSTIAIFEQKG
jgi:hypothetical protein